MYSPGVSSTSQRLNPQTFCWYLHQTSSLSPGIIPELWDAAGYWKPLFCDLHHGFQHCQLFIQIGRPPDQFRHHHLYFWVAILYIGITFCTLAFTRKRSWCLQRTVTRGYSNSYKSRRTSASGIQCLILLFTTLLEYLFCFT